MKVSLNIMRRLSEKCGGPDFTAAGVEALVEKIGAQLGGVDEVIDLNHKYQGIVVVRVVSCVRHPNADKLSLCKIDDGGKATNVERDEQGHVQVVCGAPNVREDLTAAWLPPGSTVPESYSKDPFVLTARDIRGQKSNGMLASPRELALGDNHEGILELPDDLETGVDFAEASGLDDIILDIENKMFTHRPDCFGFLGVARELAGIQNLLFKSPDWYTTAPDFPKAEADLPLKFTNQLPGLVPRFTAIAMSDVKVGPSPLWLQVALAELGQKSINNIVDYTNFYMLETGQPLHAYDYDKLKGLRGGEAQIVVRHPRKGEKVELINGKLIEPRAEAIIIAADADKTPIGIGGVMGGRSTEVDTGTTNIVLECANFDMYSVRRTSMEHGLFTEATVRFTKGQSPLQNLAVLSKIVSEIRQHAGGKVASEVIDDNRVDEAAMRRNSLHEPVNLTTDFVNQRLGLELDGQQMQALLKNVEFKVELEADRLTVTAPFWRTDIELKEDVVEEIGRLYGYDHLPLELPKRDLTPASKDPLMELKSTIRAKLAAGGANEVLTYSFVHGGLLKKVGQDPARAFQISNALSPDLQYYRLSLMPSLLDKIHANVKAGYDEFVLFELGKTHGLDNGTDDDGLPREFEFTALAVTATDKLKKPGAPYFVARKYLTTLAGAPLEFKSLGVDMQKYPVAGPYEPARTAAVYLKDGGEFLGVVGEFKPSVRRALKLPRFTAGFEVDTGVLQAAVGKTSYLALPRFPEVIQDITLKVPAALTYQKLFDFVQKAIEKSKPADCLATLSPSAIYQKDPDSKNVTLRLTIASYERTLTDAEVNKLLDTAAAAAKTKLNAERI